MPETLAAALFLVGVLFAFGVRGRWLHIVTFVLFGLQIFGLSIAYAVNCGFLKTEAELTSVQNALYGLGHLWFAQFVPFAWPFAGGGPRGHRRIGESAPNLPATLVGWPTFQRGLRSRLLIVLRITLHDDTLEVSIPRTEAVLGSDPTADVTLQQAGWSATKAWARRDGAWLVIEQPDGRATRLAPGQSLALGDAVVQWLGEPAAASAGNAGLLFGDYDDDPQGRPRSSISASVFAIEPVRATGGEPPAKPATKTPIETATKAAAKGPPPKAPAKPASPVPKGFPQPNLGTELVGALKRSPFFVGSAAIHLAVFLLLSLFWDTSQPPEPTGLGLRSAVASTDDIQGANDEFEDLNIEEESFESLELAELIETAKPESATTPKPSDAPLTSEPDVSAPDLLATTDIGVLPSSDILRGKTPKRFRPRVAPKKLAKEFESGGAPAANRTVADMVRKSMGPGGGKGYGLDRLKPGDLLVVAGAFDRIESVLTSLKLPYRRVSPYDLSEETIDFNKYKVVFWNCGKPLGVRAARRVKGPLERFVRKGGYLFTTDWAIGGVLQRVFGGYLKDHGPSPGPPGEGRGHSSGSGSTAPPVAARGVSTGGRRTLVAGRPVLRHSDRSAGQRQGRDPHRSAGTS